MGEEIIKITPKRALNLTLSQAKQKVRHVQLFLKKIWFEEYIITRLQGLFDPTQKLFENQNTCRTFYRHNYKHCNLKHRNLNKKKVKKFDMSNFFSQKNLIRSRAELVMSNIRGTSWMDLCISKCLMSCKGFSYTLEHKVLLSLSQPSKNKS